MRFEFKRDVQFSRAHDCVLVKPCASGVDACTAIPVGQVAGASHGRGSVSMKMMLTGPRGAVQFVVYTGWDLDVTEKWMENRGEPYRVRSMAADLGYHSPVPLYEEQSLMTETCEYLDGPCYYDGSSLDAEEPWRILREQGGEALWTYLEGYYEDTFAANQETDSTGLLAGGQE